MGTRWSLAVGPSLGSKASVLGLVDRLVIRGLPADARREPKRTREGVGLRGVGRGHDAGSRSNTVFGWTVRLELGHRREPSGSLCTANFGTALGRSPLFHGVTVTPFSLSHLSHQATR